MNLCRIILYILQGKERRRGNPSWATALGHLEANALEAKVNQRTSQKGNWHLKQFASHTIAGAARVRISWHLHSHVHWQATRTGNLSGWLSGLNIRKQNDMNRQVGYYDLLLSAEDSQAFITWQDLTCPEAIMAAALLSHEELYVCVCVIVCVCVCVKLPCTAGCARLMHVALQFWHWLSKVSLSFLNLQFSALSFLHLLLYDVSLTIFS